MTTTPQDLLAAVGRAIADGASIDDRRAGRQACILLASALGEPGESMASGAPTNAGAPTSSAAPRIDGGQLLDLAIMKMRTFLAELEAKNAAPAAAAAPAGSSSTVRNAAPPAPPSPATTAAASPRPRPPALRIPLVGTFGRRR